MFGFRVCMIPGGQGVASADRRSVSGTVRDTIVRAAVMQVDAPYVVCLDADTVTTRPLGELIGAMSHRRLDVASVRLVPSNTRTWLGKLQAHEYRLSMAMRSVVPWLVSGACHGARTEVLQEVMRRHSLFFQGNDVEIGVLSQDLGYRVGHVAFEVPTTVPDRPRAWFRQRLAWSGGEFRLYAVNAHLARRHPFLWAYGLGVALIGSPWRWFSLVQLPVVLAAVLALYLLLALVLNRRHLDRWVLVLPLYSGLSSLVLTPLGMITYLRMAVAGRTLGLIRIHRGRPTGELRPTAEFAATA